MYSFLRPVWLNPGLLKVQPQARMISALFCIGMTCYQNESISANCSTKTMSKVLQDDIMSNRLNHPPGNFTIYYEGFLWCEPQEKLKISNPWKKWTCWVSFNLPFGCSVTRSLHQAWLMGHWYAAFFARALQ